MEKLVVNEEVNKKYLEYKDMLWKYVRQSITGEEFREWFYCSYVKNEFVKSIIGKELCKADYNDLNINNLVRNKIFEYLADKDENCLCDLLHENMVFLPLSDFQSYHGSQMMADINRSYNIVKRLYFCSGDNNSYYHYRPAEIRQCPNCKQNYFVLFESHNFHRYYVLKINDEEAHRMIDHPKWPNDHWPERLSSIENIRSIRYRSWEKIYQGIID